MRWMIILGLILLIPLTSAITTDLKSEYLPGETIIAKISGNILQPINPSDVIFKRKHIAIAVSYDIKRIGQDYYLYAQAPTTNNNYTIFINNIETTLNGIQTTIDFNQSFKVVGNMTDYSISPGIAIVTGNSLSFIINSNIDQPLTINYNFPQENSITLNPGSNSLRLQLSSINNGTYFAQIGKYSVPIQVIRPQIIDNTDIKNLLVSPQKINRTILEGNNFSFNLTLKNNGTSVLNNIRFNFTNQDILFSHEEISLLQSSESSVVTASISRFSGPPIGGDIIFFDDNGQLANASLRISFTTNVTETIPSKDELTSQYYCQELQGKFCTSNEICIGEQVQASDGSCCKGQCTIKEKSSSGWIGYLIIGVIIIVAVVVFMRYRKSGTFPITKSFSINPALTKPLPINSLSKKI